MNFLKISSKLLITGFLITAVILAGCEKDEKMEAPELPPVESLKMDFSDFNEFPDSQSSLKGVTGYSNWGVAFLNVSVWNSIITVGMAVPVATYLEALKQDPVYLGENRWEWEYDVSIDNNEYKARLVTERISNDEYTAAMYVTLTGNGGFVDFKWFEGTVRYDRTHASWTMIENPANPSPLVSIEWNRDWEAGTGDITYTNIRPGDNESGSFISYSIDPEREYDAAYSISMNSGETLIEWNRESKAGRIISPDIFGTDQWNCWNEFLKNTDCPK